MVLFEFTYTRHGYFTGASAIMRFPSTCAVNLMRMDIKSHGTAKNDKTTKAKQITTMHTLKEYIVCQQVVGLWERSQV